MASKSASAKLLFAIAAGVLVGSISTAYAASITTTTAGPLGTGSGAVSACDSNGINVSWYAAGTSPVFSGNASPPLSTFNATRMVLSSVAPACNGLRYTIVVVNNSGTALQTLNGIVALSSGSQTFTLPATDSKDIYQYVVTIYQ